jgi:hypothetical protein
VDEDESAAATLRLAAAAAVGAILFVGLIGAVIAWARGSSFSSSMALAYYFVGSIVFLVGSFPTGGFSLIRGRSRRRPTGGGPFAAPSMLLGVLLIGFGVVLDVTHPF